MCKVKCERWRWNGKHRSPETPGLCGGTMKGAGDEIMQRIMQWSLLHSGRRCPLALSLRIRIFRLLLTKFMSSIQSEMFHMRDEFDSTNCKRQEYKISGIIKYNTDVFEMFKKIDLKKIV